MKASRWFVAVWVGMITGLVSAGAEDWTHLGGGASRQSIAVDGPDVLDANTLAWVVDTDPGDPNRKIEFEGATGLVLCAGKLFACARCGADPNSQVVAYDAETGTLLWSTRIDKAESGSCSTPCVDVKHSTVLIGSGSRVYALDAADGHLVWKTPADLRSSVVNASLCTALDLPHARAFITDSDAFGTSGRLYCINLDANEPNNPYEPGQKVWDYELGATLGNSPSYDDGMVYVGCGGALYAFNASDVSEPNAPIWKAPKDDWKVIDPNIPVFGSFWGGATVTKGFVFAATYDYTEATGQNNSTLIKVDCKDGRVVWTAAVERTDTIPVVAGEMIFVSGGLVGYGSQPKVQAFRDLGDTVEPLWPTVKDVGGWTNQPVYANGRLYVGGDEVPWGQAASGSYRRLSVLDATTGMVLTSVKGCGNSPVVTHDSVYSVGPNALMRFHQPRALVDVNGDGLVNDLDRQSLVSALGTGHPLGTVRADLDLDGDVDQTELETLEAERTGI